MDSGDDNADAEDAGLRDAWKLVEDFMNTARESRSNLLNINAEMANTRSARQAWSESMLETDGLREELMDATENLAGERKTNVELTRKIGTLNARIDELTAKPEEVKLEEEARCPECGGACVHYGSGWHCDVHRVECDNGRTMPDHEVWRRWGDTDKADGHYWLSNWDDVNTAQVEGSLACVAGYAASHTLGDRSWVIGPLPEPKAPGVG